MTRFLRLRHRLVPYLYTMNRRAHRDGEPLVQPLYYDHPEEQAAYAVRNEYSFGDRLLVAPITTPVDRATRLGAVRAWLPPGRWTDVFTGLVYRVDSPGGTTITLHRDLETIPVLAPAGAILPLVAGGPGNGTANPDALELRVYAGADGSFVLAEDRDDEEWAETRFTFAGGEVRISPVDGARAAVPAERRFDVVLCGFAGVTGAEVDGSAIDASPGPVPGSVVIVLPAVAADEGAVLRLRGDLAPAGNTDVPDRLFALLDRAQTSISSKESAYRVLTSHDAASAVQALAALDLPWPLFDAIVELLLADGRP
jgi:Glycosyl hydrolases family 31